MEQFIQQRWQSSTRVARVTLICRLEMNQHLFFGGCCCCVRLSTSLCTSYILISIRYIFKCALIIFWFVIFCKFLCEWFKARWKSSAKLWFNCWFVLMGRAINKRTHFHILYDMLWFEAIIIKHQFVTRIIQQYITISNKLCCYRCVIESVFDVNFTNVNDIAIIIT